MAHVKQLLLNSAEEVEYTEASGSTAKYVLIRIPFRSLAPFRKVGAAVIDHLEAKFKWPVIIVANRTIISKNSKSQRAKINLTPFSEVQHPTQMRPRSRTLKAVHAAVLEDIVTPSGIYGR